MANVKVFVDKQTGQKQYDPDVSMQGYKQEKMLNLKSGKHAGPLKIHTQLYHFTLRRDRMAWPNLVTFH